MPQGRILLKAICQSKKLAALKTDGARLLYTWLIPNLDINGCFSADPDVIAGQVLTRLKRDSGVVNEYLDDLQSHGLIVVYQNNGDIFLCLPDFSDKQPYLNPEREAKPTILPPTPDQLMSNSRPIPDLLHVKEKEKVNVKVKEKVKAKANDDVFEVFWKAYPRKVAKGEARKAWSKIQDPDTLLPKILETLSAWTNSPDWTKDNRKYCPHPAKWLNDGRWDDEPPTKPKMSVDEMCRIDEERRAKLYAIPRS
jgi:hypothetical protein